MIIRVLFGQAKRPRQLMYRLGGTARGYQGIFATLAAQQPRLWHNRTASPAVYFSLSHKRHDDHRDSHIWDSRPKATLDLVVLEHWQGFVQQADLYIAALGVNVLNCRQVRVG